MWPTAIQLPGIHHPNPHRISAHQTWCVAHTQNTFAVIQRCVFHLCSSQTHGRGRNDINTHTRTLFAYEQMKNHRTNDWAQRSMCKSNNKWHAKTMRSGSQNRPRHYRIIFFDDSKMTLNFSSTMVVVVAYIVPVHATQIHIIAARNNSHWVFAVSIESDESAASFDAANVPHPGENQHHCIIMSLLRRNSCGIN